MEHFPGKVPDQNDIWLPENQTASEDVLPRRRESPPPAMHELDWHSVEKKRRRLALILFIATCFSTYLAGMAAGNELGGVGVVLRILSNPSAVPWSDWLLSGALYAVPLMLILGAHEGGHWFMARRHGVPATVPFFIPFPPSPFGTMGAVILQDGRRADRTALYDIAIAGPLAGLILALPIAWIGVMQSSVFVPPDGVAGASYGDPLILKWMVRLKHGPLPPGGDVLLNPLLFAGWVGIFITALNLMPIGQLDGGHILYTLIGKRAHRVSLALLIGGVSLMIWFKSPSYALMAVLLFLTGPRHPPTANDLAPLGAFRVILGWLTLAFIFIGFTPTPMILPDQDTKDEKPPATAPAEPPMTTSLFPRHSTAPEH